MNNSMPETKERYIKPEIAQVGALNQFINQTTETFDGDGGQIFIPGIGKVLLTLPSN